NYYAVQGHTATLGIKGTVFYREVRPAAGSNSKTNNNHTPQEYICLCHGEADYMDPDSLAVMMRRETAIHHKAVLASKTKHIQLQDAGMENHTDQEIHDLIQLQSQPRHDESWLKR
ncbi:MAG: hypothetical protein OEW12_07320, partial [Deltaproteobacteria bacterium]|nr:hypothetical protein [Deltaproteobacteria bacterium]